MLDTEIKPLPKALYERAIKDGVTEIFLAFSGGSDQGYLNVELTRKNDAEPKDGRLASDIESWAEDAYEYSGAGDGTDYGDNITYDLVRNKVSTEEWFTKRVKGEKSSEKLVIDEDEDEDEA